MDVDEGFGPYLVPSYWLGGPHQQDVPTSPHPLISQEHKLTLLHNNDTVLVADSEEKLRELVVALHRACTAMGLNTNFGQGKTEVMGITKRVQDLNVNIRM